MTAIEIREARRDDLDELVALHYRCFSEEDNKSMRYGPAFVRRTYEFFLEDSISYAYVALIDKRIVGATVGRHTLYVGALNRFRLWAGLWGVLANPHLLMRKQDLASIGQAIKPRLARALGNSSKEDPVHTATLASVCVDPEQRGHRIADKLLEAAAENCRRAGVPRLRAVVLAGNDPSKRAFARAGYEEDPSWPRHESHAFFLEL